MIRQSAQENGAPEEQTRSNMESLNAMVSRTEGMGRRQCGLMEGGGRSWGDASVGLLLLSGWKGWPCSDAAPLAACPSCSNLRVACTAVPPPLLISTPKSTQTSAWHSTTLPSCCLPPCPQINYCEEQVECRRVLMLTHFGEHGFAKAHCRATCDNCKGMEGQVCVEEDLSEAAKKGGCARRRRPAAACVASGWSVVPDGVYGVHGGNAC
jgi:hypothetical protein